MKKFLHEYKCLRSRSTTETSKAKERWERVTVTSRRNASPGPTDDDNNTHVFTNIGTIRTEEYKRDLAEFQARRSLGNSKTTPKKSERTSLPISCTACTTDLDNTFSYEKKSASKYRKKSHKRAKSATENNTLPNIQFLFQKQVFMPGNVFAYSEPQKPKRRYRSKETQASDIDYLTQKQIDFKEDEDQTDSPPIFYKNNSLPYDVNNFLNGTRSDDENEWKATNGLKLSSHSSGSVNEDSCADKMVEVMSELKNLDKWADEQLQVPSLNSSKGEDSKSDISTYGLPIVTISDLDVNIDRDKTWNNGKWGAVPVQMRKLAGVTFEHVRRKSNIEINILRKCRHPNVILLMGIYSDVHSNIHIICESCVDSIYGILHIQGRILSAQTAIQYMSDIGNALVFLRMHGYLHTELTSHSIMVTNRDAAKLADLSPCVRIQDSGGQGQRTYDEYLPQPDYVNIGEIQSLTPECEPLLPPPAAPRAAAPSRAYRPSPRYRWHAPELFAEQTTLYLSDKTDVYGLALVLWECCNGIVPWNTWTYDEVRATYFKGEGVSLSADGRYPGCLLEVLQQGLHIHPEQRPRLAEYADMLRVCKTKLDQLEYIVIPARLPRKKSTFSSLAWETHSPTDSECHSPKNNLQHQAVIHKDDSLTESEKECTKSDDSPIYETLSREKRMYVSEKCFINEETDRVTSYDKLIDRDYSSACSTPVAKVKARIKDMCTPTVLHRSDSTEYCSILSPDRRYELNEENSIERPVTKLSRSFTPKSYKSLQINVPEYNLDGIKSLPKERMSSARSSYSFDIKNSSLPTTPIARSNKLRRNAWLSGDSSLDERPEGKLSNGDVYSQVIKYKPPTPDVSVVLKTPEKGIDHSQDLKRSSSVEVQSPDSVGRRESFSGITRNEFHDLSSETECRERTQSWSFKTSTDTPLGTPGTQGTLEDDVLANVNVKPLVAIHEKWIYEANKKTGRSMSLPEDNRTRTPLVKPASHCGGGARGGTSGRGPGQCHCNVSW